MNEVYYRLSETSEHYHMWGEAEKLHDIANLAGRQGFVFAPFETGQHPIVLIHADHHGEIKAVGDGTVDTEGEVLKEAYYRAEYHEAFTKMHALIDDETLRQGRGAVRTAKSMRSWHFTEAEADAEEIRRYYNTL